MGRKYVDMRTIARRMDGRDARVNRAIERQRAAELVPVLGLSPIESAERALLKQRKAEAMQTTEPTTAAGVTEPGIYAMPAVTYHADPCPEPSLSCSVAKVIVSSSVAHARVCHPRLNPGGVLEDEREKFDVGTAAHALLLEGDAGVAVCDFPDWRTNAAKEQRDKARADGRTPLLRKVWADVVAMVGSARAQLARHTDGGALMFQGGEPERTLIWRDDEFGGVWCRARLDWLRPLTDQIAGFDIDDFKTTGGSANPEDWSRTLFQQNFDLQVAWYLRGLKAVTGLEGTFRFAVQETYPPFALSVVSLAPSAMVIAEKKVLYALEAWTMALTRNKWSGYPQRVCYARIPPWLETAWVEKELR